MPRAYHYTPNESSQIAELSYNPETQTLSLSFRNSPKFRYHYDNVDPDTVVSIMFAKSIGSASGAFTRARGEDFRKEEIVQDPNMPHFGGGDGGG